jgi:hypothetical protein
MNINVSKKIKRIKYSWVRFLGLQLLVKLIFKGKATPFNKNVLKIK